MKPEQAKKVKKIAIIAGGLGALLLVGYLVYTFFFEGWVIFHNEERAFREAAEKYFEQTPSKLPRNVGDMTRINLSELYTLNRLEVLAIPKSSERCSDDSWVKVFKEDEDHYEYYVYLECGDYRSDVDQEGPEITLKGDNPYYVSVGSTYTDPGIEKVVDNEDGEMDISKVLVDSSNVNTSQIGEYAVRFTVYDKLRNKTDVTRTVHVIRNLKDEVADKTDTSNIYRGAEANNYLLFSGMLWRIVKLNEDGTVKIVLDDNAANLVYRNAGETFDQSNVSKWLNEYFYPVLQNKEKYIKEDSVWCENTVAYGQTPTSECSSYSSNHPVGMLSMREVLDTVDANNTTYFNTNISFWLLDHQDDEYGYVFYNYRNGRVLEEINETPAGVRPVINLKTDNTFVVSGNGSSTNPYKLDDYTYGRDNDLLNSRYIGEYINYSGQYFRIIGFDDDKNIKVISAGPLKNNSTNEDLVAEYDNDMGTLKFDPDIEGNIGYKLNYELANYVNDSFLVEHDFTRSYFDTTKKYNELTTDTIHAKLSIPNTFDLFSGVNNNSFFDGVNYYFMDVIDVSDPELDESSISGRVLMVNTANGIAFNVSADIYGSYAFKVVAYIRNDARIASGNGTATNPYFIK